ncbi:MAG: hypothetical protein QM650_09645 [Microlunatus sp.]
MSYEPPPAPPGGNPYGAPAGPPPVDPGRTMGIVGLVLAVFCSLVGVIVSIIAFNKSKAAGFKNNIALAGIIVGAVFIVINIIYSVAVLPGVLEEMQQMG